MRIQGFGLSFDDNDNDNPVFFAGSQVAGHVLLDLSDTLKCRSVRIEVKGFAKTKWNKMNGENEDQYRGYQEIITAVVYLTEEPRDDHLYHIPAGSYRYPFNVSLPAYCPTSFEGELGYIRYQCKAVIDRPWKGKEVVKIPISVVSRVDLNEMPEASRSVMDENTSEVGCGCCPSGEIEVTVSMDQGGFVPGEKLDARIEIKNNSRSDVTFVDCALNQNVDCQASRGWDGMSYGPGQTRYVMERGHTKIRDVKFLGCTLQHSSLVPGEDKVLKTPNDFIIPSAPPILRNCAIIKVNYRLDVKVHTSDSCSDVVRVGVPVIIGTEPLRSRRPSTAVARPADSRPTTNTVRIRHVDHAVVLPPSALATSDARPSVPYSSASDDQPPDYFDLPPPSYEQCMFGATNNPFQDDDDEKDGAAVQRGPSLGAWAPSYPVFRRLTRIILSEHS